MLCLFFVKSWGKDTKTLGYLGHQDIKILGLESSLQKQKL